MEKYIAILMVDLNGYTALTDIHGAEAAAHIIDKYIRIAKQSLTGDSFLQERVGDQLMIVSDSADNLAKTAITLQKNLEQENGFLKIHSGLHYGRVLELNGHLFGSTVNLTARLMSKAGNGELICSKDFMEALKNKLLYQFIAKGIVQFKNVLGSKMIFGLLPAQGKQTGTLVDPVCKMIIGDSEKDIHLHYQGETHYFCSYDCRDIFQQNIFHYVPQREMEFDLTDKHTEYPGSIDKYLEELTDSLSSTQRT